jgi:hypothetical protein
VVELDGEGARRSGGDAVELDGEGVRRSGSDSRVVRKGKLEAAAPGVERGGEVVALGKRGR